MFRVKARGRKGGGNLGMVIIERETPMRGTGKISKIMRQDGSKEGNEDIRPKMRTGRPFPRHKASRSRQLIRFQESFPKIPTRHQTLCWVRDKQDCGRSVRAQSLEPERKCPVLRPAEPGQA